MAKSLSEKMLDAIELIVDNRLKKTTMVYSGTIESVNGKQCTLIMNGKEYTMQWFGGQAVANAPCRIVLPQGNMSSAFAIC